MTTDRNALIARRAELLAERVMTNGHGRRARIQQQIDAIDAELAAPETLTLKQLQTAVVALRTISYDEAAAIIHALRLLTNESEQATEVDYAFNAHHLLERMLPTNTTTGA